MKRNNDIKERKDEIMSAAMTLASKPGGFGRVTLVEVAKLVGCTHQLILHYYSTVTQFKRDIVREAIRQENLQILAQALILNDQHAKKAPDELKRKVFNSLK